MLREGGAQVQEAESGGGSREGGARAFESGETTCGRRRRRCIRIAGFPCTRLHRSRIVKLDSVPECLSHRLQRLLFISLCQNNPSQEGLTALTLTLSSPVFPSRIPLILPSVFSKHTFILSALPAFIAGLANAAAERSFAFAGRTADQNCRRNSLALACTLVSCRRRESENPPVSRFRELEEEEAERTGVSVIPCGARRFVRDVERHELYGVGCCRVVDVELLNWALVTARARDEGVPLLGWAPRRRNLASCCRSRVCALRLP